MRLPGHEVLDPTSIDHSSIEQIAWEAPGQSLAGHGTRTSGPIALGHGGQARHLRSRAPVPLASRCRARGRARRLGKELRRDDPSRAPWPSPAPIDDLDETGAGERTRTPLYLRRTSKSSLPVRWTMFGSPRGRRGEDLSLSLISANLLGAEASRSYDCRALAIGFQNGYVGRGWYRTCCAACLRQLSPVRRGKGNEIRPAEACALARSWQRRS